MKAVVLETRYQADTRTLGTVACREVPEPVIQNGDDVKIKISYASICGSDPNILRGLLPNKKEGCLLGHEIAGTVVAVGPDVNPENLRVGDRVVGNFYRPCGACDYCRSGKEQFCDAPVYASGSMAEYIVWRASQVFRIPDSVDMLDATLTEPLSIAVQAIDIAEMRLGARVAISGCGGIGMMLVQLARLYGASTVAALEPVEDKRDMALSLGADVAIDPRSPNFEELVSKATDGQGFDIVIESSGNGIAAQNCLAIAAPCAHLVYFSMYPSDFELKVNLLQHCYHKQLRIQGMYLAPQAFPKAIQMLKRVQLRPLVSGIYSLDDCKEAFAQAMSGKNCKILFDCQA